MFPSLGWVILCSRCHVGPSGAALLATWPRHSRCAPCMGCVYPFIVVEPWLLLEHQWEGFIPRMIDFEDWLPPPWRISCVGVNPTNTTEQESLQHGSGACWVCSLHISLIEVVGWYFGMVWNSTGCTGSGASWKVQAKVSLCSAQGHPPRATEQSADGCYFYWAWRFLEEGKLKTTASFCLCWAWGHLERGMGYFRDKCCLY